MKIIKFKEFCVSKIEFARQDFGFSICQSSLFPKDLGYMCNKCAYLGAFCITIQVKKALPPEINF